MMRSINCATILLGVNQEPKPLAICAKGLPLFLGRLMSGLFGTKEVKNPEVSSMRMKTTIRTISKGQDKNSNLSMRKTN